MVVEKIRERIRLTREDVISKRSIIERDISDLRESLGKLSESSKEKLSNVDFSRLDARVLFPSLYEERFDYEKHQEERLAYASYMQPILDLRKELLEIAAAELQVAI